LRFLDFVTENIALCGKRKIEGMFGAPTQ